MKESYRLFSEDIPKGLDVVFIARNTINERKQDEVGRSMQSAWKKIEKKLIK